MTQRFCRWCRKITNHWVYGYFFKCAICKRDAYKAHQAQSLTHKGTMDFYINGVRFDSLIEAIRSHLPGEITYIDATKCGPYPDKADKYMRWLQGNQFFNEGWRSELAAWADYQKVMRTK